MTGGSTGLAASCSPLRRGWSPADHVVDRVSVVLPAQAGVSAALENWTVSALEK